MRLFRRRPLLDAELADWQFLTFGWLLRHTGGLQALRERRVITPTPRDFPQRGMQGHALAEAIFDQVRIHARMREWPCELLPQEADPNAHVAPTLIVEGAPQSPAGTYRRTDGGVVITYKTDNLRDPESLVATLAHELSHYRTAGFPEPPPGGWELWEPATDLCAVFLGFGLFLANSHFRFSQFIGDGTIGWRSRRQGYLSEPQLLHAHAIFCHLQALPADAHLRYLKPALRGMYKRLYRDVAACGRELDALRTITAWRPEHAGREAEAETEGG